MQRLINIVCALIGLIVSGCSLQSVYVKESYPTHVPPASNDSISHTIFFIGDAGEPSSDAKEPVFEFLVNDASNDPMNSTIIFLGDNIYPRGLPELTSPDRREMERRLDEQISIGGISGASTIFVPGNHDWQYQGIEGYEAIVRQDEYIASMNIPSIFMAPQQGLPGPSVVDIGDDIRIIAIDTQWWLHEFSKPFYDGDTSEEQTKRRFLDSLSWSLQSSSGRKTIVVAHHPLKTHGEHGGFFDWKDHLFPLRKKVDWLWLPLPGLGSLYPLSRMWGISNQDLSGSLNREMSEKIDSVLSRHTPMIYAAGHEHALQVLERTANHYYMISGNAINKHQEAVTSEENTIFAAPNKGYIRLDFLLDGSIRVGVSGMTGAGRGNFKELFSMLIR